MFQRGRKWKVNLLVGSNYWVMSRRWPGRGSLMISDVRFRNLVQLSTHFELITVVSFSESINILTFEESDYPSTKTTRNPANLKEEKESSPIRHKWRQNYTSFGTKAERKPRRNWPWHVILVVYKLLSCGHDF